MGDLGEDDGCEGGGGCGWWPWGGVLGQDGWTVCDAGAGSKWLECVMLGSVRFGLVSRGTLTRAESSGASRRMPWWDIVISYKVKTRSKKTQAERKREETWARRMMRQELLVSPFPSCGALSHDLRLSTTLSLPYLDLFWIIRFPYDSKYEEVSVDFRKESSDSEGSNRRTISCPMPLRYLAFLRLNTY